MRLCYGIPLPEVPRRVFLRDMTNKNKVQVAAAVALAVGLAGVACDGTGSVDGDDVGSIQLALQMAPADGLCLRLTVDQPSTSLKLVKTIGLTPNAASQTQVGGLPVGSVGLLGEVFNVACTSVTATTPLTWISDRLAVTITPDLTQTVTLTLRRAGKVNLGVDFVANAAVEEIRLSLPPLRIAAAPDGTMVLTMTSSAAFWRVSTAFNLKQVATIPGAGQPRLITTAPDGSVLVTSNSDRSLFILSGQGALKSTLALPFTASDVAVDPAGIGWVGAMNAPQIIRISNVQGVTPASMLALTMPTSMTAALSIAPDGTPRVGGAVGTTGLLYALTSSGGVVTTTQRQIPVVPRDMTATTDGTMWAIAQVAGNNVYKAPTTANASPVYAMAAAPADVAIVTTSKGVVFADAAGGLVLVKPDGVPQGITLPGNAVASSLAVNVGDGRVWATVPASPPRLLAVTLP
jgi:streptogramin lyase